MEDWTLWGRVERQRVAVPLAVVGAMWVMLALGVLVTGVLSVGILSSVAAGREREAGLQRSAIEREQRQLGRSDPRAWLMSLEEYDERLDEVEAWEHRPLPVLEAALASVLIATIAGVAVLFINDSMLLQGVRARVPGRGEFPRTHRVIAQASLAAGLSMPPVLRITDESGVNGFYVRRREDPGFAICLTVGATALPADEQRSIVANLLSRATAGRVRWLTRVAPLLGVGWWVVSIVEYLGRPLQRGRQLELADVPPLVLANFLVSLALPVVLMKSLVDSIALGLPLLAVAALEAVTVVSLPLAATLVASAQNREAELGDSEGLLLTRDPVAALRALTTTGASSTSMRVGRQYAHLCWAWPTDLGSIGRSAIAYRRALLRMVSGPLGAETAS